jgi:hypothetical protein
MGVSGQRHAPAALYPRGKDRRYPLDRRLGGPQSRSDAEARRKNLCPCRRSNPDRPARSQTLYCLSFIMSVRRRKKRNSKNERKVGNTLNLFTFDSYYSWNLPGFVRDKMFSIVLFVRKNIRTGPTLSTWLILNSISVTSQLILVQDWFPL